MTGWIKRGGGLAALILTAGCASLRPPVDSRPFQRDPSALSLQQQAETGDLLWKALPDTQLIADPCERFNRGVAAFNDAAFLYFIYPINVAYRFIFPEYVRKRISNLGLNLAFPVRLVNTALQGKFRGTWDETARFGVNTTVGLLGLYDPATRWGIPLHREDFGQTFGYYGAGPGVYLMLPFIGPSSGRDAVGRLLDWPFDLSSWLIGARPFFTNNDASFQSDQYRYLIQSEPDLYMLMRMIYTLDRQKDILDYAIPPIEGAPDPSLGALAFKPQMPKFRAKAKNRSAPIAATGEKLPYSCWMQKEGAPLVVILSGLGGHRLEGSNLGLADLLYRNGYHVAVYSSVMHPEFMGAASTTALPGYAPRDIDDVLAATEAMLADLEEKYPGRIQGKSLVGVSLGAFQTGLIAARAQASPGRTPEFARYLMINPPVDLPAALRRLDEYFAAPSQWPDSERLNRAYEALYKAIILGKGEMRSDGKLPLTLAESQFLIGLSFRIVLTHVIYDSQRRRNLGFLTAPLSSFRRQPAYNEIRRVSYSDYMNRWVLPYYLAENPDLDAQTLSSRADLRSYAEALGANTQVRAHVCRDDFLLGADELAWLQQTLGGRLTVHEQGGHLGELWRPDVHEAILRDLGAARVSEPR